MTQTVRAGPLALQHHGTALGSCRADHPGAFERIGRVAAGLGLARVVVPRLAFTNAVTDHTQATEVAPGVFRADAWADGVWLDGPGVGVVIANGDCTIGLLYSQRAALVLHLGLACVHRADGQPTVLQRAIDRLGGDAAGLRLWLGGAIGPCCHGYPPGPFVDELRARWGQAAVGGVVRWGPRKGQVACDHQAVVAAHALHLGVGQLTVQRGCTACAGLADPDQPGFGTWFSHTRDVAGTKGRNLGLAWWVGG